MIFQQYYYTQPGYTPYVYQAPASGVNPTGYAVTKDRLNILFKDIEGYIDSFGNEEASANFKAAIPSIMAMVENSIAQTQNAPGAAAIQPSSDAEFAAYREKQNQIFKSSGDLSAQLSGLKFY